MLLAMPLSMPFAMPLTMPSARSYATPVSLLLTMPVKLSEITNSSLIGYDIGYDVKFGQTMQVGMKLTLL